MCGSVWHADPVCVTQHCQAWCRLPGPAQTDLPALPGLVQAARPGPPPVPQQCTARLTWVDGLPHAAQHLQGGEVPLDVLVACLHQAAYQGGGRVELCDLQGVQVCTS